MGYQHYLVSLLICAASAAGSYARGDTHSEDGEKGLRGGGGSQQLDDDKDHQTETSNNNFYDLSQMTQGEKMNLAKLSYSLVRYGDGINWDIMHRDHFLASMSEMTKDKSTSFNIDGNDDAYDGMIDDTLSGDVVVERIVAEDDEKETVYLQTSRRRRLQGINNIDGDVFGGYEYSPGNCPNAGSLGVPCAPPNLSSLCNKYDRENGSLRECINACKPAFCCVHDAPDINFLAPNCNADENCDQYNYCYIAWWKLHDTVGPALFLRVEQDDEFYDIDADEIQNDSTGDTFFTQVLLHHFDNITEVIADGTVGNEFNADNIFVEQGPDKYWNYPVTDKVSSNDA